MQSGCITLSAILLLLAIILFPPVSSAADIESFQAQTPLERVVLSVTLNGESKGDFFAYITPEKDFLLKADDIDAIGIREIKGRRVSIEGEEYIYLSSVEGLEVKLDEKNLLLELTASPYLLSKNIRSLMPQKTLDVRYPKENSAFLNYRLLYSGGEQAGLPLFNFTGKLGIRTQDLLFLTDSAYTKSDTENRLIRLQSNITYEKRQQLQRLVFGDFFAFSGDLGTNLNMGGVSFSKVYQLDPYFVKQPVLDLAGAVPFASEAEIYLDGVLIGKERLQPGPFELRNISYYGGMHTVEVVIKDPFGNTTRITHPFYFTDILLKKGLHEYSYNLGLLRNKYGIESNSYGSVALSAYHRYGFSDALNIGIRAEAADGIYNFGPQIAYRIRSYGILSTSLAVNGGEQSGMAGSIYYTFQTKKLNLRALAKGYSERYAAIGTQSSASRPKVEAGIGAGYSGRFGAITIDYSVTQRYSAADRKAATATYTTSLLGRLSFFATFRNIKDGDTANEFFLGLNYYPDNIHSIAANYQRTKNSLTGDSTLATLQIQKAIPQGEGWGYRALIEKRNSDDLGNSTAFNPFIQYNSPFGIYTAEYRGGSGTKDFYSLSASGAVVYAGGLMGLSRPVNDAFAFIKAGDLKGVRVMRDGLVVGRTGRQGKLIVPDLRSYYYNRISLEPSDIPIEYTLSRADLVLSPASWSGSCVLFDAEKVQAFTGYIYVMGDADMIPLEFYEVRLKITDEQEMVFATGKGGEFYFENLIKTDAEKSNPVDCRRLKEKAVMRLVPGPYKAYFQYRERTCEFEILIPESEDVIVDLGKNICKIK